MSAAALLERLRATGITLEAHQGYLLARPREALTPHHLEQIRAYREALLELLHDPTTSPPASPPAWRLWRIHHRDGTVSEHSFTPPQTLAQVRREYPDAQLEAIAPAE